jgi:predicted nucleic acid-binding protein
MTAREGEVVFDTWAWFEVLQKTAAGSRLHKAYVEPGRVVTPALALTELAGKVWRSGADWRHADEVLRAVRLRSRVVPLDDDVAALAAQLSKPLRAAEPHASYADAIMLATARTAGLPLISNDRAFRGCPDVRPD